MFLSPRKSIVDVVQSVGRVMRKSPGKKYGYIILPIAIPEGVTPEVALRDNAKYQVVWEVLQALRAHDDRLNAEINKIDLTKRRRTASTSSASVATEVIAGTAACRGSCAESSQLDEWRDAVYARIVRKVGSRRYWEDWAKSVAEIAEAHITRINALLDTNHDGVAEAFDKFLDGLRANLNEGITRRTRSRCSRNTSSHGRSSTPCSADTTSPRTTQSPRRWNRCSPPSTSRTWRARTLTWRSSTTRSDACAGHRHRRGSSADHRRAVRHILFDAFKRTVDKLGIVYTPVEIVDFILRRPTRCCGPSLARGSPTRTCTSSDGFTGTGTFMTRLIASGLIESADLPRKYQAELHANEILLLAYYIAAVNIETTYQDVMTGHVGDQDYLAFPGLVLTDTFQSYEDRDRLDYEVFRDNNARLEAQKALPITVIVGNPPYSAGQDSANDDNANESYPALDAAIRATYAESPRRPTRTRSMTPTSGPSNGRRCGSETAASSRTSRTAAGSTPTPPTACARP